MPIYRVSFYCQDESKRNLLREAFGNYFIYNPQLNDKIYYLYDYEWYIDYESDIKLYETICNLSKDKTICNLSKETIIINITEVVEDGANYMKEYLVDDTSDKQDTHNFILEVRDWLTKHPCRRILPESEKSA